MSNHSPAKSNPLQNTEVRPPPPPSRPPPPPPPFPPPLLNSSNNKSDNSNPSTVRLANPPEGAFQSHNSPVNQNASQQHPQQHYYQSVSQSRPPPPPSPSPAPPPSSSQSPQHPPLIAHGYPPHPAYNPPVYPMPHHHPQPPAGFPSSQHPYNAPSTSIYQGQGSMPSSIPSNPTPTPPHPPPVQGMPYFPHPLHRAPHPLPPPPLPPPAYMGGSYPYMPPPRPTIPSTTPQMPRGSSHPYRGFSQPNYRHHHRSNNNFRGGYRKDGDGNRQSTPWKKPYTQNYGFNSNYHSSHSPSSSTSQNRTNDQIRVFDQRRDQRYYKDNQRGNYRETQSDDWKNSHTIQRQPVVIERKSAVTTSLQNVNGKEEILLEGGIDTKVKPEEISTISSMDKPALSFSISQETKHENEVPMSIDEKDDQNDMMNDEKDNKIDDKMDGQRDDKKDDTIRDKKDDKIEPEIESKKSFEMEISKSPVKVVQQKPILENKKVSRERRRFTDMPLQTTGYTSHSSKHEENRSNDSREFLHLEYNSKLSKHESIKPTIPSPSYQQHQQKSSGWTPTPLPSSSESTPVTLKNVSPSSSTRKLKSNCDVRGDEDLSIGAGETVFDTDDSGSTYSSSRLNRSFKLDPKYHQKPSVGNYVMDKRVGEGTYGTVYKGQSVITGTYVALKKIKYDSDKGDGFPITAVREIKLLQSLHHTNIVELFEIVYVRNGPNMGVWMVFEYLDYDLTGIMATSITYEPQHIKCLMKQMFEGLLYLHSHGILHRDMKGSNLLLNSHGILKLADFGLARRVVDERRKGDYTNRVITLWYRPPELLLGSTQYAGEVDMWGAGCILIELVTRSPAFDGRDEIEQLDKIYRICGSPNSQNWPDVHTLPWYELVRPKDRYESVFKEKYGRLFSPQGFALLERLLSINPAHRLTAAEALRHPYFSEEPLACDVTELPKIEGDWHELEYKDQQQREKRKQKQRQAERQTEKEREAKKLRDQEVEREREREKRKEKEDKIKRDYSFNDHLDNPSIKKLKLASNVVVEIKGQSSLKERESSSQLLEEQAGSPINIDTQKTYTPPVPPTLPPPPPPPLHPSDSQLSKSSNSSLNLSTNTIPKSSILSLQNPFNSKFNDKSSSPCTTNSSLHHIKPSIPIPAVIRMKNGFTGIRWTWRERWLDHWYTVR